MSTFKGVAKEFPQLRIDYFRAVSGQPPPLAGFLTHVHSDHLAGLEGPKGYFIYCSPATKEILIRLEKFPHRMNFSRCILECRKQTYKHLETRLRTIPLCAPTVIELSAGNEIRVTLFDANHCTGSSMFLIESDSKAILYTGDIRSEVWWVNSLVQNPILIPYTLGSKRLDMIYLDTTFASKREPYLKFPSKADGLRELIDQVSKYPKDTTFYIESWTFGYENVWIAISSLLSCPIHLDRYRWGIYKSLERSRGTAESCEAALVGFQLGNTRQGGCLTPDPKTRIHSCERGTCCPAIKNNPNVVRIVPIVTRLSNGREMHEMGIGGGKGDLDKVNELEVADADTLGALMQRCATRIDNKEDLLKVNTFLLAACQEGRPSLRLDLDSLNKLSLDELIDMLVKKSSSSITGPDQTEDVVMIMSSDGAGLPKTITFPYSRHSSYSELCALVKAFRPRDVYACTVDQQTWASDVSMEALFGHLCSDNVFAHDAEMRKTCSRNEQYASHISQSQQIDTQRTNNQVSVEQFTLVTTIHNPPDCEEQVAVSMVPQIAIPQSSLRNEQYFTASNATSKNDACYPCRHPASPSIEISIPHQRNPVPSMTIPSSLVVEEYAAKVTSKASINIISPPPKRRKASDNRLKNPREVPATSAVGPRSIRTWAYYAVRGENSDINTWDAFGGLSCVTKGEDEL